MSHSSHKEYLKLLSNRPKKKTEFCTLCGESTSSLSVHNRYKHCNLFVLEYAWNGYSCKVFYVSRSGRKILFRSKFEADFAKKLDCLGIDWEYEGTRFPYTDSVGRERHYIPDFYIVSANTFVELKPRSNIDELTLLKLKSVSSEFKTILITEDNQEDSIREILNEGQIDPRPFDPKSQNDSPKVRYELARN